MPNLRISLLFHRRYACFDRLLLWQPLLSVSASDMKRLRELDSSFGPPLKRPAITASGESTPWQPVKDYAINYLNKMKMRDENVYGAFLEILITYRKGKIKSISEVFNEVVSLLIGDHVDLLEEFRYFLPDDCTIGPASVPGHHSSSKPSSVVRRDDNTLMASSRHTTLSERSIVKREKVGAIQVNRDRGFELPEEREKEREKQDGREHKGVIKLEKESELVNELIDEMQRLTHKHETSADELICKQSQVGEGGENFVGASAPAPLLSRL